jgi:hypothetical protein
VNERTILGGSTALTTGWKTLGLPVPVERCREAILVFTHNSSGGADAVRFFAEVSDDNVTFRALMNPPWTNTLADTVMTQVTLPTAGGVVAVALPEIYYGRYLRVSGSRDSTSGSARAISIVRLWCRNN